MTELARIHIRVYGRVQGVFFRANTRRVARRLGLTGWVRNVPDGSVEIVAEGPREKLEELVEWARHGPPLARVTRVDAEWEEYKGEFEDFEIRY